MNYTAYVQQLSILAEQAIAPAYSLTDVPDFSNTIPSVINYAEGRIYRECVFLATRTQDHSLNFTAGNRSLSFASISPSIIVPEGLAMITPVSTAPAAGVRQPFDIASLDLIDIYWPQESITVDPSTVSYRYWALKDATTIIVGPTPDKNYTAEITGLFQPVPLSQANSSTYLSATYPDLFLAASMIFLSAFLRDFGAQSDDPQSAQSWETQYGKLVGSVGLEEQRRRSQGNGWSPNTSTPLAKPPRN